MVDEASRCLAEGVVSDAGMLDLAMIMGTGFPPHLGGLLKDADQQGLNHVVDRLESTWGRRPTNTLSGQSSELKVAGVSMKESNCFIFWDDLCLVIQHRGSRTRLVQNFAWHSRSGDS